MYHSHYERKPARAVAITASLVPALADRLVAGQQQEQQQQQQQQRQRQQQPTTINDRQSVSSRRRTSGRPCSRWTATRRPLAFIATTCLLATTLTLLSQTSPACAASNRINMHQVSRQTNQCKYACRTVAPDSDRPPSHQLQLEIAIQHQLTDAFVSLSRTHHNRFPK
jgi:hypothetical protein